MDVKAREYVHKKRGRHSTEPETKLVVTVLHPVLNLTIFADALVTWACAAIELFTGGLFFFFFIAEMGKGWWWRGLHSWVTAAVFATPFFFFLFFF